DSRRGLRGLAARLAGLARARPRQRGDGRQAAPAHAGAIPGAARRPRLHGVRDPGRRRAAAGHAPGAAQHGRLRHGAPAGGGGPTAGHAQLPRFVLAPHQLTRSRRRRGPHRPGDPRRAGEARPRHHRLARLRLARGRGLRLGGGQGRRAPGRSRPTPRRARHRLVAGARLRRLSRRRFTVVALLGLGALLGGTQPTVAQPTLPLPPQLPPKERHHFEEIVKKAFASTRMEFEPYIVRPEIFEYLLDHPEFASHVTRALKAARYKIWREGGSLWLDDGWGVKGTFALAHAEPGLRLMYAQGAYQSALPDVKGRAVVALAYKFQPAPQ